MCIGGSSCNLLPGGGIGLGSSLAPGGSSLAGNLAPGGQSSLAPGSSSSHPLVSSSVQSLVTGSVISPIMIHKNSPDYNQLNEKLNSCLLSGGGGIQTSSFSTHLNSSTGKFYIY